MEMHQVRYFLAVTRELNFTRAAEGCDVTQPSLTRAIQKLEAELGGPLFRRERSRTHLTDLGRLMLPHLERTYEAAQAAKELAMGLGRAEVAPLSLGIQSTVASAALDTVLTELSEGLPGFELSLSAGSSDDLLSAAMDGSLDLIISELPDDLPERVDKWPLFSHAYCMVTRADHPLARTSEPSLDAARDEIWIDYEGNGCAHLKAAAAEMGFEPIVRHVTTDMASLKRLVLAGLGSAFMPRPQREEGLRAIMLPDATVSREVVLGAVAGRKRSIAADAFVRASRARSWSDAAG